MSEPEIRTNSRAALVEAAFEEFTTRGYEAATVAGIAERAGVTTGAVYAHFANKLDLLLATVGLTPIADVARSLDGLGAVGASVVADVLARGLAERPDRRRVLLLDAIVAARRDPKVAEVLRSGLEGYVRATARALRAPASLSRMLTVLNLGMVVFAALDARTPPATEFRRVLEPLLPDVGSDPPDAGLDRIGALAAEVAGAEEALREAIAAAVGAGHSLRQVGAAAGRSHEAIRRIAAGTSDRR